MKSIFRAIKDGDTNSSQNLYYYSITQNLKWYGLSQAVSGVGRELEDEREL